MGIPDGTPLNEAGFAHRDLLGLDRWVPYTVSTNVVAVGTLSTAGRWREVGRKVEYQAQLSAATSIAITSGIHFISLPNDAAGLAGFAVMTNTSTKTSALGAVEVSTSRVYLPTQAASAAVFTVCGWYEPKG